MGSSLAQDIDLPFMLWSRDLFGTNCLDPPDNNPPCVLRSLMTGRLRDMNLYANEVFED